MENDLNYRSLLRFAVFHYTLCYNFIFYLIKFCNTRYFSNATYKLLYCKYEYHGEQKPMATPQIFRNKSYQSRCALLSNIYGQFTTMFQTIQYQELQRLLIFKPINRAATDRKINESFIYFAKENELQDRPCNQMLMNLQKQG